MKTFEDATRFRIEWSDVTWEDWQKILQAQSRNANSFEIAEILTGRKATQLMTLPSWAWHLIAGEIGKLMASLPEPKPISRLTINGHSYVIPAVKEIEARRYEDIRTLMVQVEGTQIDAAFPRMLAIALAKDYTEQAFDAMEAKIRQLPMIAVLSAGTFFLKTLNSSPNGITPISRLLHYLLRWLRQVTKG